MKNESMKYYTDDRERILYYEVLRFFFLTSSFGMFLKFDGVSRFDTHAILHFKCDNIPSIKDQSILISEFFNFRIKYLPDGSVMSFVYDFEPDFPF